MSKESGQIYFLAGALESVPAAGAEVVEFALTCFFVCFLTFAGAAVDVDAVEDGLSAGAGLSLV